MAPPPCASPTRIARTDSFVSPKGVVTLHVRIQLLGVLLLLRCVCEASTLFNLFFTVEAVLRVVSFIPFHRLLHSGYVLLDFISVTPFYVRMFLYPVSLESDNYLSKAGAGISIRVFEALGALRLLKLCWYYEGASLLATAVSKSLKQLYVPLFMLLVMVFCFAAIVYVIEFDPAVQDCVQLWKAQGVAGWFLKT